MSTSDASEDPHGFIAPDSTASRSPCPALNTLANHGYLPRDGRNLGFFQVLGVLQNVYNVSLPLSMLLTVGGFSKCGKGLRLDLDWLAAHNKLEHDASLVHADAAKGAIMAPIPVDPAHLEAFLNHSTDGTSLTISDLARYRAEMEAKLEVPLDPTLARIAKGELALATKVMQNELNPAGAWPLALVKRFFGEEKLPDGWRKSETPVGFTQINPLMKEIADKMKESGGGGESEGET